jgi:hypothetical protein
VTNIHLLAAALLLMPLGCSQPNARVQTRFNYDAELSGELPYDPLQWEVIASTLNHGDHTLATVLGNDQAIAYARKHVSHEYSAGSVNIRNHMVSAGRPSMVRGKHTGQAAIRRVPRSAIRPRSRADVSLHHVWRFTVEKADLHRGKIPHWPSGKSSGTTGSSHALKLLHTSSSFPAMISGPNK